ncbi:MAG: hypothetical protein CMN28_13640 [Salinisphaeraceae bacterium]|jgi:flavin-binding protein dodecin|nr:hypothetical protein [Salinisphaeraceae bacterium]
MATYAKTIEMSAESPNNFDDAIEAGVQRANDTIEHISNVWVKDQEVIVENGTMTGYRAHLKVTFQTKD